MSTELTDWDDAFANAPYIPDAAAYPERWRAAAAAFRAENAAAHLDIAYGAHPRERFDMFMPQGAPRGLVVFFHGGFWKAFGKSDWSHLAAGAVARGWAAALPGYVLVPEARLSAITQSAAAAIAAAAREINGPIRLVGHSAGGHLATRMLTATGSLETEFLDRVDRVVSISGLHDLRPLLKTEMNAVLKLDAAEAARESAALAQPIGAAGVVAWVGALERPEFIRQSRLLSAAWPSVDLVIEEGRHHFDVIDGLIDPQAPLSRALLDG